MNDKPIRFLLNGEPVTVHDTDPTRSVLSFLREDCRCTGTKEGCAEGDCGACTVVLGELKGATLQTQTVNACIQFVPTLDGKALFTVEHLRRNGAGLHPAQQAMVDCHGSQCGFCTPGFVMSLWNKYNEHEATGTRPDRTELATCLSGNLCRCTGYRPILEAGEKMFDLPRIGFDRQAVAAELRKLQRGESLRIEHEGDVYHAPRSLEELLRLRAEKPDATLLAGCTDIGLWVNKQFRPLGDIIYVGEVDVLKEIDRDQKRVRIGAGVSLTDAYAELANDYPQIDEMWERFASVPIRNAGTLGGNVANGSPIGDSMPWLIALGANVVLTSSQASRTISMEALYVDYMQKSMRPDELLEAVEVPLPTPDLTFRTYKLSKRFDSDISAVCAAFAIRLEGERIKEARVSYGGMAAIPKRAAACEAALVGQPWQETTVRAAMQALDSDFSPMADMRATAVYRAQTAANLLYRFYLDTRPADPLPEKQTSVFAYARETSCNETLKPASHAPHPHESAHLHVRGEATYVDDIPELAGTLHCALGLSEKAHANIRPMDLSAVRSSPGVEAVLTAADIPGKNDCGPIVHDDPVLADARVQFVGQPIFAVLADSYDHARRAARKARIDYQELPAVLTPQEARRQQAYVLPPIRLTRGDVTARLAAAPRRLSGEVYVGGQEQFYLEGQISYVAPKEDDGLYVWCSTQHPSEMQKVVCEVLGLRSHQVTVEMRRMGGGFGGKESQSALFCCVAALGAYKLKRPVKIRLDRDDDMMATGKRHCFYYQYEVGFEDDGRINAARIEMVSRAGFSADLSAPVATRAVCHFDNAYYLSDVDIQAFCGKTNTQSNTAFRGFGGPQGAIAIEYIIDNIARELGLDPLQVQKANFYGKGERDTTPYGQKVEDNVIQELVEELEKSSDYGQRRAKVRAFNAGSPVLKKGLAITPVKFGISFNVVHYNQAGALVHVYVDGSALVNHGGTEMGQGLNTKVAQVVAGELGISLNHVRATAVDTSKVANTSATAASTGADLNGKAAEDAARQIRQRLAAFVAGAHGGDPDDVVFANDAVTANGVQLAFAEVVEAAYQARVQLWSDGFYATPGLNWDRQTMTGSPFYYFAYGAAVSEVIVDTLTGEWKLLQADLLHDAGNSINSAIDIGQVEGAYIQGMGWLTMEELWWNDQGRLMTHAPSTYKIPAVNDCPAVFNTRLFNNSNHKDTILRSKAVGEPPLLLAFSVFFAIRDAVASVGDYRVNPPLNAPATSEAILNAVTAVQTQASAVLQPVA